MQYYLLYIYLYFDCENRSVEDEAETLKRQGQRPTPLISMQSGKKRYIIIHQIFHPIIKLFLNLMRIGSNIFCEINFTKILLFYFFNKSKEYNGQGISL